MLKVSIADKNMFLDDSGVEFTPYKKIADKIDECLSLISYHRTFNNITEMVIKEQELSELREQIKKIKKRNHN